MLVQKYVVVVISEEMDSYNELGEEKGEEEVEEERYYYTLMYT